MYKVLIADDETTWLDILKQGLSRMGFDVTACYNGQEALDVYKQNPDDFDLLLTDHAMPFMTGLDLAKEIHKMKTGLPIILYSGHINIVSPNEAAKLGIDSYIIKPIEISNLAQIINDVIQNRTPQSEITKKKIDKKIDDILGI